MSNTWPEIKLSEVADEITVGHVGPMASRYVQAGVPFLRSQNVRRLRLDLTDVKFIPADFHLQLSKSRLRPGDVVVVRTGEPGVCAVVPQDLKDANCADLVIIRPGPRINAQFLAYYMNEAAAHHVASHLVGAVQQHFNVGAARILPIRLPSITEQEAIVEVLGILDEKIEQNRRTGRALEALARATFKAWFVDFEPVKAKAAGATSFPGMPGLVFATLPDRLTSSPLGLIPEGWEVRTLEEIAESVKGLSYKGAGLVPPSSADHTESLPLHNLNSVYEGGGYKNEGIKRYNGEFKDRHVIYPGDLIVANTEQGHEYRLIGFPAILPNRFGERGLFSHHLFRVRPLPNSPLGVQYLYHAILSARVRDEIIGCTNGTTVNMLSIDGLKRPQLCVPNREMADEFEKRARTMYDLSEWLIDESSQLAALRDYLLPKLLSGQVRVVSPQKK